VEQIQTMLGQPGFWIGFLLGAILAGGNILAMRHLVLGSMREENAAAPVPFGSRFLFPWLIKQVLLVGVALILVLVVRVDVIGLASGLLVAHFSLRGQLSKVLKKKG